MQTEESEHRTTGKSDSEPEIQAVARTAQILGLYSPTSTELSAAEVASTLGLNRTTAHRYLTSMAAAGLLTPGSRPATFSVGPTLLQLGASSLGRQRVIALAPRYLRDLSHLAQVTVVLSLWGTSGPVVSLVEEDAAHGTIVTVRSGTLLGLRSSQAMIFMTFLSDRLYVDRLLAGLGGAEMEEAEARMARIRATGYDSSPPNARGVRVVSSPVFDRTSVCATVALVGTDRMFEANQDARVVEGIKEACANLTGELGGVWETHIDD
jgi:DNA-binding IclR family transcriptional regulator